MKLLAIQLEAPFGSVALTVVPSAVVGFANTVRHRRQTFEAMLIEENRLTNLV